MSDAALPAITTGDAADSRPPVVLLHGFAGDALAFAGLQPLFDPARRAIALDLPGHGKARDWPSRGGAGACAKAVVNSLDALGIPRAHLVGHSMGGAAAALAALRAPDRAASLTLLAPGGFGPEINARLLRRFASATTPDALAPLVEAFFGFRSAVPEDLVSLMVAVRADAVLVSRFREIAAAILEGEGQNTLPMDALAGLDCPARIVWGTEDQIVPVHQIENAPEAFARHVLSGVGHLPHVERSGLVARIIAENAAAGDG